MLCYILVVCVLFCWYWFVLCEWMRGLGLGFTNPVGEGGVLDVCMCFGWGSW